MIYPVELILSHSKPFLSNVYKLLTNEGYRVWYDQYEMGFDLVRSMKEGIERSTVVLCCVGQASIHPLTTTTRITLMPTIHRGAVLCRWGHKHNSNNPQATLTTFFARSHTPFHTHTFSPTTLTHSNSLTPSPPLPPFLVRFYLSTARQLHARSQTRPQDPR